MPPAEIKRQFHSRKGAIAVLMALLLIPILAFMAFCIDLGWITSTKSELQNAADASAAAGAQQLMDNYAAYSLPGQSNGSALINAAMSQARTYSTQYGGYNGAGGVCPLTMLPGDIVFGFTDAQGTFQSTYLGYPNTVQVVARRDATANGRLPLFFAPVLGTRDMALTATASGTIYTGLISSFDPNGGGESSTGAFSASGSGSSSNGAPSAGAAWGEDYASDGDGFNCLLLPVAFDVNFWNAFLLTGVSPDGAIHMDSNGTPQIKVYPGSQNTPGNFGLLCIGTWTNADPAFKNWILNGPSSQDLQYLIDNGLTPVSATSPKEWKGTPGLRSSLQTDFAAIIGQPRLLPLFQPVSTAPYQAASGNGSNARYNIVGFAGVIISEATGRGSNMDISVQPYGVTDPTAVFDPSTVYPLGAAPLTQMKTFTHTGVKFTQ